MYIRCNLTYIRRDVSTCMETDDIECIWVEVKHKQRQIYTCLLYRPPSTPAAFVDKLNYLLEKASSDFKEMLIFCDFNCDILNVNTSFNLLSCLNLYQLSQLIQDPTRVTHTTKSAIDLFFNSQPELITESGVLPIVISDHYLIYGIHEWTTPKQKGGYINFRSFENINYDAFADDFSSAPWHQVSDCKNVDDAWTLWLSTFMSIANLHAPEKNQTCS